MTNPPHPEVAILNAALELRPADRTVYLDHACTGDAALRRQVEALLQAHEHAENFLEAPPAGLDFKRTIRLEIKPTEKAGDKIGRYKLLQQIGEGGCGVVYMAEQEEPVRRRVALKVIKLGMDTKQVIARFEAERQALALMDHPNIAKVLDAGATEAGRPYFVMELVRGIKITDYCDQSNLSTRERLDLFVQICRAIQHAHQKGIIHRDIKPSNILVTVNDGVPVPKVIDFGIAKATQGRLTDKTLFTAFEQFIGTPAYMSPEQAEMTSLDIDTRSDIYSLGVLLYELLTGKTPFDANELFQAGLDAMRRTIREKEPQKPSTRLSTMLDAERMVMAKHRQTESPKLVNLVRGDLDWIAMKCLEKDRVRRYETANGLAADIQRHLNNEPVVARPPSAGYRTTKFIRRHKVVAAMSAAVTLALLVGLVAALAGFAQARRERDHAQAARNEAVEQKFRADQGAAENHRRLVLQYLANGNRSVDAGDHLGALPWFGRALEVDQADAVQAEMHRLRIDTIIQQSPKLVALCYHNAHIRCAEFSPDGTRILTSSSDGTSRVWNAANGEPVTPFMHHHDLVLAGKFSPDGRWVATAGYDGTVVIWDAHTGERRIPPLVQRRPVRCLAFSSDGQWIVTGCEDHEVQVWEAATGRPCGPPLRLSESVNSVEFGGDNQSILTRSSDNKTCLWAWSPKVPTKLTFQWEGWSPTFSPDGKRIALLQGGNSLQVYDAATGNQVLSAKVSAGGRVVTFSPDGRKLLTLGESSQIWDAVSGSPITAPLRPSSSGVDGSFSPDGRWVMIAGSDKSIRFWDAASGELVAAPLKQIVLARTARFSPDGRRILMGCDDGSVQVWDLAGSEVISQTVKHPGLVYRMAFHPDSHRVLTVSLDGTAVYWELASGRKIESVLTNLNSVTAAEFSADGQRVAIGYGNGTAQIWNLISGAPMGPALHHNGAINHVEFSPDGARLVTAGADGLTRVWRLTTGGMVTQMSLGRPVSYATFTPDGEKVVTANLNYWEGFANETGRPLHSSTNAFVEGTNAAFQVWNAATGSPLGPPLKIDALVSLVSLSPDRRYMVTACPEVRGTNQMFVWDLTLQKPMAAASPLFHASSVLNASFSPDGRRVITCGAEGTIRIWDAATGQRLTELLSVNQGGLAVFSPDGRLVIGREAQRDPRLWDASTGEPVTPLLPIISTSFLNRAMFSPDGHYIVVATGDGNVRSWEIPRSGRTQDDELRYAQMLSGSRVNEQEAVSPLTREQVMAARDELRAKYPGEFTVAPEQETAWKQKLVKALITTLRDQIKVGHLEQAKPLVRKLNELGGSPEVTAVLDDLIGLGETMDKATKAGDTQSMPVEALRTSPQELGNGNPSPAMSAAGFLYSKGNSAAAEKLFEDVIALKLVTSGDHDFDYGYVCKSYGEFLLYWENKPAVAMQQLPKALPIFRAWPEKGNQLFWTLREIGDALVALDRAKEGEPYHQEALTISRTVQSDKKNHNQAVALSSLGFNLMTQKRFREAELNFREARDFDHKSGTPADAGMAWRLDGLARSLTAQKQLPEAELIYREELSAQEKLKGAGSDNYASTLASLNEVLKAQGKPAMSTEAKHESH